MRRICLFSDLADVVGIVITRKTLLLEFGTRNTYNTIDSRHINASSKDFAGLSAKSTICCTD